MGHTNQAMNSSPMDSTAVSRTSHNSTQDTSESLLIFDDLKVDFPEIFDFNLYHMETFGDNFVEADNAYGLVKENSTHPWDLDSIRLTTSSSEDPPANSFVEDANAADASLAELQVESVLEFGSDCQFQHDNLLWNFDSLNYSGEQAMDFPNLITVTTSTTSPNETSEFTTIEPYFVNLNGTLGPLDCEQGRFFDYKDLTFVLQYPKVAQKSYGHERRFIGPNSRLIIHGNSIPQSSQISCRLSAVKIDESAFDGSAHRIFSAEQPVVSDLNEPFVEGHIQECYSRDSNIMTNAINIEFKKLYINELEKQKQFKLNFEVLDSQTNSLLYRFITDPIKVLSKPSQLSAERHSVLNINSGSTIALFNRVKSQSGTTRFLGYDRELGIMSCDQNGWNAFVLWSAKDVTEMFENLGILLESLPINGVFYEMTEDQLQAIKVYTKTFPGRAGDNLEYGQVVHLQEFDAGRLSIPFVLCHHDLLLSKKSKANRLAMMQSITHLSQMHRIALEYRSDAGTAYLSLNDERVGLIYTEDQHSYDESNPYAKMINQVDEKSVWTIIMIDCLSLKLQIPYDTHNNSFLDLTKLPRVTEVRQKKPFQLILQGENFTDSLSLLIGPIGVRCAVKSEREIVADIPMNSLIVVWGGDPSVVGERIELILINAGGVKIKTGLFVCTT